MKASDLTKASMVSIGGVPHRVEAIQVQTPSARGGASLYKVRFRNVQSGQKVDQTLRGEDQLQEASFETREIQYLYKNGDIHAFMDLEDYTQFELPADELENAIPYLIEDMEGIKALVSEGKVLAVTMPDTMEMQIVECDPSIKGASATARTKPATLSTGLVIQVPEYISPGERIRVDTRTNTFLKREG
jgi:elongation factor P